MIFTKEENNVINKIIEKYYDREHEEDIIYFIMRWSDFIDEILIGFDGIIVEYTNYLYSRVVIQHIIDEVSDTLKKKILEFIEPLDDQYVSVTKPIDAILPGNVLQDSVPFEKSRIPKILLPELKESLMGDVKGINLEQIETN